MDKQRKLQKFSIRKYTVGTCSILIGTLIFLGLPTHDAFASENVIQKHAQEEKAEGKSTDPVEEAAAIEETTSTEEAAKEIGTAETPAEQPQEEATTEAPAVDETTQDATTNEESTTEDKSTTEEASTEEATQVDTVAPEAAKVETAEKAEQTKAEAIEVAKEETSTEEATETAEPAVNTVDAVQPASVEETTPAVDTPTVEATVTNTISDVDTNSVSSKSLEDIVNNQNKDKVDATTLEQPSRQAPKSGESYSSVFRAAELQTRNVSNWVEYFRALEDRNVGTINFTQDISMPKSTRGPAGAKRNHITLSNNPRAITVNLNGHVFDAQDNFIEVLANGKNQPAWNFTFNNGHIKTASKTNNAANGQNNGIFEFKNGSHGHVLNLRNIEHSGGTLINDENIEINIHESLTSHNTGESGSDKNITIGGKFIRSSDNSTINMDMTTKGKIFKVYGESQASSNSRKYLNGNLSFGHHSTVNLNTSSDNPFDEDNAHTIFSTEGKGVRIVFGDDSTVNLTGQNIFAYGDQNGMFNTGKRSIITVEQKGNGNILDFHSGSVVNIEQGAEFNAVSKYKLNGEARWNNLIGMNSNSTFNVWDNAVFKLDARNHKISENGEKGGHNPVFTLPVSGSTKSEIILKENSTFDIKSDNPDDYSELIGFGNVGGGDGERGIFIEGTVKYFNLQRTNIVSSGDAGTYYKPTGNVTLMYGDLTKNNMLKWSGNHEVRTWDARQFSGKGMYDSDIDSNVSHIWNNISNFSSTVAGKHTKSGSTTVDENKSTIESNNGLSIKEMDIGRNQRFLLIGNTIKPVTVPRPVKYQAQPNENEKFKKETTISEGKDGTKQTITNRMTGKEESEYVSEENKPVEKVIGVNNVEVVEETTPFATIYRANPNKLDTEAPTIVQAGQNGTSKTKKTYEVNPENGELSNPTIEVISSTAKQDKIVEVGSKNVSTAEIPVEIEYRDNPDLAEGTEKIIEEGQAGTKTVTKVYNIDPNTGNKTTVESSNEEITTPMHKRIVERGTGTNASLNNPGYSNTPTETKPGKAVDVPQTGDTELPAGTKFSIPADRVPAGWTATVDPNTGKVTATPPADAKPNTTVDIPVEVTYPDKTKDNTTAKVKVVPNDAQDNNPGYSDTPTNTKPGKAVKVPQTGDTTLPPGTKFSIPAGGVPTGWTATINPDTGEVTATPPANATPDTIVNIPVEVTYPDKTKDTATAKVKVVPNDAQDNDPNYGNEPV
ncbi:YPDG domain-containing protein, partial [Mammaliicoccus sciuri]|uniref:YPDG domain-containing protein n=1 Tax=Mammaliicoccus sciuri TaxID=1296 RepID=UPI001FB554FE